VIAKPIEIGRKDLAISRRLQDCRGQIRIKRGGVGHKGVALVIRQRVELVELPQPQDLRRRIGPVRASGRHLLLGLVNGAARTS
jgi:hypothetical protein